MRFLTSHTYNENNTIKQIIVWFLFFILLYISGDIILFYIKYSFNFEKIADDIFGPKNFYIQPSFDILIEEIHTSLFIFSLIFLIFSSLIAISRFNKKVKVVLITLYALTGLLYSFSYLICAKLGRDYTPLILYSYLFFRILQIFILLLVFINTVQQKNKEQSPIKKKKLLYSIIPLFSILTLISIVVNFILFKNKIGLSFNAVTNYYLGTENIIAKSMESVMETSVIHFVVVAIFLLIITHFLKYTKSKFKNYLVFLVFFFALMDICSAIFLVLKKNIIWSVVKLLSFILFEILLLCISLILLFYRNKNLLT